MENSVNEDRRLTYLAKMKIERENYGVSLNLERKRISPRRVLREVVNLRNNQLSPSSAAKRERDPASQSATIISPSKIRHKLFVDQAKTLTPGERLVHCPLCTSPSRVSVVSLPNIPNLQSQKAECSSPKCQFSFCPECKCQDHGGSVCRTREAGTSSRKAGGVTSKKSKARLRRLWSHHFGPIIIQLQIFKCTKIY